MLSSCSFVLILYVQVNNFSVMSGLVFLCWASIKQREKYQGHNGVPPVWFKPSSKIFYWQFQGGTSFVDHLCYLCLVFFMLSRLFIAAFWSPAWKGLTSWLLFVMFNCAFVTFPCGFLGQVCYLIVSIPDLCRLSYFIPATSLSWVKHSTTEPPCSTILSSFYIYCIYSNAL